MDTILEDFEFLDLSDASDFEKSRIKGILVRPLAENGHSQRHFQTPWNPPPPDATAPPPLQQQGVLQEQQQQPLPPPPVPQPAYHGGVQLNGGSRPADVYPPPPPQAMMQPPPPAAPAPRPVMQLNPQAGVFVNTQPFPPAPYYQPPPPQTPTEVVVGRQGPRSGKKRDVTPSGGGMPPPATHVIWNQPPHYYPGATPLIVGQFSPVPAPGPAAYVSPPPNEQELKEQVPYSPYNPHHHQQHHPHHHYPQEQHHHHHQRHHMQIQMAPAPVAITAPVPVAAPVNMTAPPPVAAPQVPVAAPVNMTVPPPVAAPITVPPTPVAASVNVPPPVAVPVTPVSAPVPPQAVLPPPTAVQIVPLKFSGNQLINGPKQLMPGSRPKPAGGGAPPATAVETKARAKSVAAVAVKEEKPQPANSTAAAPAAVVKVEIEEKKPVVASSNDEQSMVKQEAPEPAAKASDVTNQGPTATQPNATVKPAEIQPTPQPVVTAPAQVTAPSVAVPPPAPQVAAAPTFASLFSNSSSSPASRGVAAPPPRRYSGAPAAAPPSAAAPAVVDHHGEQQQLERVARQSGEYEATSKEQQKSSGQQQRVNSVVTAPPSNSVTSPMTSSAAAVNNVSPLAGDPGLLRLAEYLSSYKLDHRAALLRPRGLTNRSNYCYINATLQALLACPPLYNLLKKLPLPHRKSHAVSKSKTPIIDSMVQFVNEFEEMVNPPSLLKSRREKHQAARDDKQQTETVATGAAFEPTYVYRMMNTVIRNESAFPVEGRQEDAEEFLSCLLNGLNDEMVELLRLTDDNMSNGEVIATNGDNCLDQDSDNEWKEISKKKPTITRRTKLVSTPLSQIFQGQWRSRVVRQGASETDNIQPFFTFPLDIEKAPSVKEALENITAKNMLEGFTCPKTNRTIEAYQQLYLEELPLVLLLHLKCFDYRLQTCSKIIKNVEFTIELKIEPKLMAVSGKKNNNNNNTTNNRSASSSMKEREYKLFAVVYHDGKEATKGHYVTDVYHVGYGTWLRFDDANVRAVPQSHVLTPRPPRVPYLLYYRRKDTIAPPPHPPNAKPQKTAANES